MKQYQHHIHKSVVTFLLFISHLTLHACLENPPSRNGPPANGLDWIANNLILPKFSKLEDEASPKINTDENLRLPTDLLPSIYNIQLLPLIEDGRTDGEVDMLIDCVRSTRNISFHSANTTIQESSVKIINLATGAELPMVNFFNEQLSREIVTIQTSTVLEPGRQYQVSMKFSSILNNSSWPRGFYRASYVENGITKYLAATQFEPPHARRAFPCFDEPGYKARFSITLGRKRVMKTASNMRLLKTNDMTGMPDYVWDYYETSSPMSSYLVAFLVAEFEAVPAPTGLNRVPFRIWTRPDFVYKTGYSLDRAPRIQQYFEDYFEIPYSYAKQDLAAIPEKGQGAMENWGLITYGENILLIDEAIASEVQYQDVASVNAHELAHQWFGNLMTTEWWNTIWLNEGFATYFEYIGMDAVEPEWMVKDQFITITLHNVFGPDGLETSRPINKPVQGAPTEISAVFDQITYDKGSCIIRMMSDILGEQTFKKGLTRFLNDRAFKNAVEDDLWKALNDQAIEDGIILPSSMKAIMDTWTLQMGYPVVSVVRNYETNSATVSQERFLFRKSEIPSNDSHVYRWWIPLTYTTESNPNKRNVDWLSDEEQSKSISVQGSNNNQWALFNIDQKNYYRVAYDEVNYGLLTRQLSTDHTHISVTNRGQILDDAFNLALANLIPYQWALDVSLYLQFEKEYVPWRSVLTELDYMDIMLYGFSDFELWKNYLTTLILPYYEHVGFSESSTDAHLTIYSRTDALNWACKLEIPECVRNAQEIFTALMDQPDLKISPNQRSLVLRTGVGSGGENEWNFALEQYNITGDSEYLIALTQTKQVVLITRTLELLIENPSVIKRSDVETLFTNVASTPLGNGVAFDFLINRWNDILAELGDSYFVSFYYSLSSRLNKQSDLEKYLKLRDDHIDILGSSIVVESAIENVQINIKWLELHQVEIGEWLKNPTTTSTSTVRVTPSGASKWGSSYQTLLLAILQTIWLMTLDY